MITLPPSSSSILSLRKTTMTHATLRSNGSIQQGYPLDNSNRDISIRPLLPQQAQAKLHHSPSFRKAVLSFKGHGNDLIERAIEFDYITKVQGPKKYSTQYGCTTSPLLPQQAQQRLDQSPKFRKAVLSFEGHSNCLIERAIELEYFERISKCMNEMKFT
mmetsp:Transcript_10911/g.16089  ORF Transcript_10911/g.16089 Transcript_10911/m.16089 type:complete len:160 (+) Transcript_10911:31-510(+)